MYKKDLPQNLAKLGDWHKRLSSEQALKKVNVQFKTIVEQYDLYFNGLEGESVAKETLGAKTLISQNADR